MNLPSAGLDPDVENSVGNINAGPERAFPLRIFGYSTHAALQLSNGQWLDPYQENRIASGETSTPAWTSSSASHGGPVLTKSPAGSETPTSASAAASSLVLAGKPFTHRGHLVVEAIVEKTIWKVPERSIATSRRANDRTELNFWLKITNRSHEPLRIGNYLNVIPTLTTVDGRVLKKGGGADSNPLPKEADYPVIAPGETVFFKKIGQLYWDKSDPEFCFWDGGFFNIYRHLRKGKYYFGLEYSAQRPGPHSFQAKALGSHVGELWTGDLKTSLTGIEIR